MDAAVRLTKRAGLRTAKPCGSDAPTLASSSWKDTFRVSRAMVTTKPGHQEEHGVSRKTIAQGMPDVSAYLW